MYKLPSPIRTIKLYSLILFRYLTGYEYTMLKSPINPLMCSVFTAAGTYIQDEPYLDINNWDTYYYIWGNPTGYYNVVGEDGLIRWMYVKRHYRYSDFGLRGLHYISHAIYDDKLKKSLFLNEHGNTGWQ